MEVAVIEEGESCRSDKIHYAGEGNILDELQVYAFVNLQVSSALGLAPRIYCGHNPRNSYSPHHLTTITTLEIIHTCEHEPTGCTLLNIINIIQLILLTQKLVRVCEGP